MNEWYELLRWLVTAHAVLISGALIMLLLLSGMLRQRRNPAASAAWLVFMVAIPYLGVPLYLFFGTRKLTRLAADKQCLFENTARRKHTAATPLQHLLDTLQIPPATAASDVHIHQGANQSRASLLDMLQRAQTSIDISIFILGADAIGKQVIGILAERADRGIPVRLLLDGVGSFYLFRWRLRPLLRAGGEVAWFVPVLHIPLRGRTNLRNHRKLVIVDQSRVWTGGRNIADDYLQPETRTHWIDLSFDLAGPVVDQYLALFNADWAFAAHQPSRPSTHSDAEEKPGHLTQLLPSGPDMTEDVLHDTLAQLFMQARQRIVLVTPYFVPSEVLQALLCVATRSGVVVDIVLPLRSNHHLADFARNRFLRQLENAGARIWCLPDAMLHAKALVIDDNIALAGSANFDLRSLYLNFELMTLFYDIQDIAAISHWIDAIRKRSRPWTPGRSGVVRETLEGLVLVVAFQL